MEYPSFIDNKTFFSMDDSKSEVDQIINLSENLKKIHYLTTVNYQDLTQCILEYLNIGLKIFEMKIGIVSEIVGDQYTIVNAISPGNVIKKDDVYELEDTYCREVCRAREVLGFPYVGGLKEMKDHPVYVNMKLESYISAPIMVENSLYGTLNFTSTEPRAHGFSEHERDLISLMANSIGSFLELDRKTEELVNTNDRLKRLVGYVAHDLRNPLGSIKGLADFIEDASDENRHKITEMINISADKAIEIIENVLETAAMGTGKIELNKEKVDLSNMIRSICKQYESLSLRNNVKFECKCSRSLYTDIDPRRMEQVFTNLLSNTMKYSTNYGLVTLSEEHVDDNHFRVIISNPIGDVDSKKQNFDVNQSVGFGLEIVREILKLHGSALSIETKEGVYITSFVLSHA